MGIDFEVFSDWAESRFDNIVIKDNEVKINSIFCEDYKYHLWCSPSGGKNKNPYGVYHCWKTDEKGTLVNLVMKVDKCSFEDALATLNSYNNKIEELEEKVQSILSNKKVVEQEIKADVVKLKLPIDTYAFDDLPSSNKIKIKAEKYLNERKIKKDNLFICVSGKYRNRIIIPYYNKNKELIYYNSRSLDDNKIRYLGPPKEIGIGKGDVIYMPDKWPIEGSKIYLTEGEFDAISLWSIGYDSAAFGGKNLTQIQMHLIKNYIPVLCLDSDEAGSNALVNMGDSLLKNGFEEIYYVRAPKKHKDWNKMLQTDGEKVTKYYIMMNEKKYDYLIGTKLRSQKI